MAVADKCTLGVRGAPLRRPFFIDNCVTYALCLGGPNVRTPRCKKLSITQEATDERDAIDPAPPFRAGVGNRLATGCNGQLGFDLAR